jgi:hypothetical protein
MLWYSLKEMVNKPQFRALVCTPSDSSLGLLATSFSALVAFDAKGILPVIAVAIIRISMSIETG